ncbi:MAG TPA: VWA domain-containing protein [Candidatus Acidoferrales bacterium]|nr:VWA domain-containing protein [Candidatus Acidoferrales bacterium]
MKRPPLSPSTISVETKLVTLYATVRDKHGKIVPNLDKQDFVLDEDGQPQTISHFVRDTDVPLTLGLLVDTSYSQRGSLDDERKASYTFLDHMLSEKDRAFVIHFDRDVELLQDLTSARPKLQAAMQLLDASPRDTSDDDQSDEHRHAGTLLYDAIYLASNDLMKKQQGRKALFVLTDGVDRGSKKTLEEAVEAAQRADTSVYSILFPGVEGDHPREHHAGGGHGGWGMGGGWPGGGGGWPGGGGGAPGGGGPGGGGGGHRYPEESHGDGKKVLDRISTQTGGRLFEVSKKSAVDQIYAAIEDELRNQYSLAYSPSPADTGAGYHKIHLTATNRDLTVQARDGYYTDR